MRKRLDRVRKDCEWDEMQESRVNDGRSGDRRTKWEILASRNKKRNTDAEISQKYNTIVQMIFHIQDSDSYLPAACYFLFWLHHYRMDQKNNPYQSWAY